MLKRLTHLSSRVKLPVLRNSLFRQLARPSRKPSSPSLSSPYEPGLCPLLHVIFVKLATARCVPYPLNCALAFLAQTDNVWAFQQPSDVTCYLLMRAFCVVLQAAWHGSFVQQSHAGRSFVRPPAPQHISTSSEGLRVLPPEPICAFVA